MARSVAIAEYDGRVKFVEDPRVVIGDATGPDPRRSSERAVRDAISASGPDAAPSKAIDPVLVVERHLPGVRVRQYHASVDGKLWISSGFMELSLVHYTWLRFRGRWARWREPIPRAEVR